MSSSGSDNSADHSEATPPAQKRPASSSPGTKTITRTYPAGTSSGTCARSRCCSSTSPISSIAFMENPVGYLGSCQGEREDSQHPRARSTPRPTSDAIERTARSSATVVIGIAASLKLNDARNLLRRSRSFRYLAHRLELASGCTGKSRRVNALELASPRGNSSSYQMQTLQGLWLVNAGRKSDGSAD